MSRLLFFLLSFLLFQCGQEQQAEEVNFDILRYQDEDYLLSGVRDTVVNELELEFSRDLPIDVFLNGQPYQLFRLGTEDDIRPVLVPVIDGIPDYDRQLTFSPLNVQLQASEGLEFGDLEAFLSGGSSTIFKKRRDHPPPISKSM
jgi:hypothetical protein